jgi:hypothetical protein
MKITFPKKIEEMLTDFLWGIPFRSQALIYSDHIGDEKHEILVEGCIPDWFPNKLKEALTYIKENSPERYFEILKSTKKIKVGKCRSGKNTIGQAVGSGIVYVDNEIFKDTYPTDLSATIFHEVEHIKGLDESSARKAEYAYLEEMHSLGRHPAFQNYIGRK